MSHTNRRHLYELPRVFQTETVGVDPKLLKEIFSLIPRASGAIRNLLRHIYEVKLLPSDDPYFVLSVKLPFIPYREKWYNDARAKKRGIITPFYDLVDSWIHLNHDNLGFESTALAHFFERRLNKRYPRLEHIELLSEQLIKTAEASPKESALFAWSLIERTQWFSQIEPEKDCLTNFREVLLADLSSRGADELLELLKDGSFMLDSSESNYEELPLESKTSGQTLFKTVSNSTICQVPTSVNELNDFYLSKLREMESLVERATTEHRSAKGMLKSILCSEDITLDIKNISQLLENLQNIICETKDRAKELEQGIAKVVMGGIQHLHIGLAPINLPEFSISTFEQWKGDVATCLEVSIDILRHANTLSGFEEEIIRSVTSSRREKEISLESAVQYLSSIRNDAIELSRGLDAKQKLIGFLEAKQGDFSWNPILDTNIQSECWINLGKLLAAQGSMPRVLGICGRTYHMELNSSVATAIDRTDISLKEAFDILELLTLGQVERINCVTERGKLLLAIAELKSYLQIAEDSPTEAYAFWSAMPLSEYINEYSNSATERFFRALYEISNQDDGSRVNITEFRRLANLPDASSLLNSKQVEDSLRRNLKMAVEHHKGGGQTYAHLWDLAYDVICKPIKQIAEEGALNEAAVSYRLFRNEFDSEKYIQSWISTLSVSKRKDSQYKAHLRTAVNGQLKQLDEWLDSYDATITDASTKVSNDPVEKLKVAISEIRSSSDPRYNILQSWLLAISETPILNPVISISLTRSLEPNITETLRQEYFNANYPRVFLAMTNGHAPTIAELLADELYLGFDLYTTEKLSNAYASQKHYEAFSDLSSVSPDRISVDVERRVEAEVDDLENKYLLRIAEVESQLATLRKQDAEIITGFLPDIRRWISEQKWTKAGRELSDIELTLNQIAQKTLEEREIQSLLENINALGGHAPTIINIHTVNEAHNKIVCETRPRRKHLDCLNKILAIEGLDFAVRNEYQSTISELERPDYLPSAERSELVELIFLETIEILRNELLRSNQLRPDYVSKLKNLALITAKYIKEYGVNEQSKIVSFLIETGKVWQKIPSGGGVVIDQILGEFNDLGFVTAVEIDDISKEWTGLIDNSSDEVHVAVYQNDSQWYFAAYIERLAGALSRIGTRAEGNRITQPTITGREGIKLSDAVIKAHNLFEKCDDTRSNLALGYLTDWVVLILKNNSDLLSVEEYAAALHLINRFSSNASVHAILPSKSSKGQLGEIVANFMTRVALDCGLVVLSNPIDQIQYLSENVDQLISRSLLFLIAYSPFENFDSITLKNIWELYSGDVRQPEARAALMNILWQTSTTDALAHCLSYPPIELELRKARAFSLAANQALEKGRVAQLQSFIDLRKTVTAKPFQIFVDMMQKRAPIHTENPASFSLAAPMEKVGRDNLYCAVICIIPRSSESPDSITITLPKTSPLRFQNDPDLRYTFEGPFLEEKQLPIQFRLLEQKATEFSITLECESVSINGIRSKYSAPLTLKISGAPNYIRPTHSEIDEAFDSFPEYQVRGVDYVPRENDEKKITKDLFDSKVVRSLWISSPRRSGKTTLLYWILDAYSQKAKRDTLVAYFTLSSTFLTKSEFNHWLWSTLNQSTTNKELRKYFDNFSEIGRELPFEADSGTFLEELSDRLKMTSKLSINRVIYLIDEVDKFASMHINGGEMKRAAEAITWSIRDLISKRGDIGFVFAGSSAAKKIFLSSSEAPFFNTTISYELTPFSCENLQQEKAARAIVEPPRMQGRFQLRKKTLEHLIWICAGIPYYMKLLAGATMAVAKQPYLLESDINAGLQALLSKTTGVPKLDEMPGTPGSDELRTIAVEQGPEKLLTEAVVYAVAEMGSSVTGQRLFRGKVFSAECPLVSRYSMPKDKIKKGLELAIDLGILRISTDDTHQSIYFSIPILGESIRYSCGSYWGSVEHRLDDLKMESGSS